MNAKKPGHENDTLAWFKSSYSAGDGGQCVEVAGCASCVHVRDSKDTGRLGFVVSTSAWTAFVGFARR
ncbi:DUF397 domain-containing protein [Streptomyces sp. NPDC059593]|uniref:DUF397 domain-containing protein n=1 Tax=Streptomyces sp. NPDC059593 TaxID=3346878 RepID=UPI0036C79616